MKDMKLIMETWRKFENDSAEGKAFQTLMEQEFKKYAEKHSGKLLAEGKSPEEVEKILEEGWDDITNKAKRLARKYGLPVMAVASILTSTPAFAAGTMPSPPKEVAAATREMPPEEEKSFWGEVADWLNGSDQEGEPEAETAEQAPLTSKDWRAKLDDLLEKTFGKEHSLPGPNGNILELKFVANQEMKDAWAQLGYEVPDSIDVEAAMTRTAKQSDVESGEHQARKKAHLHYIIFQAIVGANTAAN